MYSNYSLIARLKVETQRLLDEADVLLRMNPAKEKRNRQRTSQSQSTEVEEAQTPPEDVVPPTQEPKTQTPPHNSDEERLMNENIE